MYTQLYFSSPEELNQILRCHKIVINTPIYNYAYQGCDIIGFLISITKYSEYIYTYICIYISINNHVSLGKRSYTTNIFLLMFFDLPNLELFVLQPFK